MKVKLSEKKEIAEGTLYVEFTAEETGIAFNAGQFFRLTLINPTFTDERGNSRFLGFVNTPSQNKLAATVTRAGPSAFKRSLGEAGLGMEAEIDGVDGKMTLPDDPAKPVIIITGGIGISPIMSLLRWVKEKSLAYKITLLYSNTNQGRAIFLEEITKYTLDNLNFKLVATMTQDPAWPGERRRFDQQFFKDNLELLAENKYFVTGTPRFVPVMVRNLRDIGVNPSQMKFEIFTGY